MPFTCPRCGRTSHNPNDEEQGYCGACHWWTGDSVLGQVQPPAEEPSDTGPVVLLPHLTAEELDVLQAELGVAYNRWEQVLRQSQSRDVRLQVLRRMQVIFSLRTACAEAYASLRPTPEETPH